MRHKGAVDRHIRDIYKTSERRKKDAAEEAREMARVDAVRFLLFPSVLPPPTYSITHRQLERHTQKT